MKYLRHRLGGGKIDMTSEACPMSTVDRKSRLECKTSVWSSHLTDVQAEGAKITNSIIESTVIKRSQITGGKIQYSAIIGAELVADYAVVISSAVYQKMRVAHTAYLFEVMVQNWTVYGDAQLIGWGNKVVDGHEGYISRGRWERPPQVLDLDGLTITEGVPGFAFCGCREFEIAHWLKCGDRYGRRFGLTPEQIDEIRQFLLILQRKA